MAVNQAGLESALLLFFNNIPPGDDADAARASAAASWASAVQTYATTVSPLSTTVSVASATLQASLYAIFSSTTFTTALADMETAFAAFAVTVASGMFPSYVGTPPPSTVGFATLANQSSVTAAASAWTSLIHTWFTTGTATPSGGGSPIFWS